MQSTQSPTLVPLAWAANGTKNTIPEASQITITPGAASLNDGFPPICAIKVAAGGIAPAYGDFNGILNLITQSLRWQHAGGQYGYNSTFANDANVGGYPRGAVLMRADNSGMWLNRTDNNATNPDTGGAGWVAAFMSGAIGQVRNLAMNVATASATATITADEIVVGTGVGNQKYVLGAFSQSINLAAAGAGGMDTGAAPSGGVVGIYAIYNPTTGAQALLAVNGNSALPSVYGGSNMPSGYTASALISVRVLDASSRFLPGVQYDRRVWFQTITSASVTSQVTTLTALTIAVPANAKVWYGWASINTIASINAQVNVAGDANLTGNQQVAGGVSTTGSGSTNGGALGPVPILTPQTVYWSAFVSSGTFTQAKLFTSGYEF